MADLIVYMLLLSITPGPNTIASLINASEKGFFKGITLNLGMVTGIFTIASASYIILATLGKSIPTSSPVFQILGAIYLLYLAYSLATKGKISLEADNKGGFKTGFMMQLVNVKVFLLCITAISSFIIPNSMGYPTSLLIPAICFLSQIAWVLFGSAISNIYRKYSKAINIVFALMLLYLAIKNVIAFIEAI